ncbi:hypothetical protein GQ42DRAFT_161465 [Ramicandelaber brevisporus]|nr:hypothetical protein GQ42DRAFT_161465 [Ramicandelaber brevisporus]
MSTGALVYSFLVVVRAAIALTGYGYIHPDQFFQSPEIAAGDVFGLEVFRPWEFNPAHPNRSIVPVYLTTGLPFMLYRYVLPAGQAPSPSLLALIPRVSMLGWSLILDMLVYQVLRRHFIVRKHQCWTILAVLASMYTTSTFQTTPFSNSLEAVLVISALNSMDVIYSKLTTSTTFGVAWLHSLTLGVIIALGCFTRITFAAFIAPMSLVYSWKMLTRRVAVSRIASAALTSLVGLGFGTAGCIAIDTLYYTGSFEKPVIAPLANVLYNMDSDNLAQHGLHPRYLHIAVNMPVLLGPLFILWILSQPAVLLGLGNALPFQQAAMWSSLGSVAMLSVFPHQEARFLLPNVALVVLALSDRIALPNWSLPAKWGQALTALFAIFNVIMTIIFGYLHQSGVAPSLLWLSNNINSTSTPARIYFYKTYMPPRHLFVQPNSKSVIYDIMGQDRQSVAGQFATTAATYSDNEVYLVTPSYVAAELEHLWATITVSSELRVKLERVHGINWHVNFDDLDKVFESPANNTNLNIYRLSTSPLH